MSGKNKLFMISTIILILFSLISCSSKEERRIILQIQKNGFVDLSIYCKKFDKIIIYDEGYYYYYYYYDDDDDNNKDEWIGQKIYYDASLKILLLNKIKKNFKATFTFKGEDITISKTSDYFIMTYKDYQCLYSFLDDRVFSFSNPTLNPYNIKFFKDFEKEVNKDVDFLIEFLNS